MNIKEGMVLKIRTFDRDSVPDHWVYSMTAFSGKIVKVLRINKVSDEDEEDSLDRIYLDDVFNRRIGLGEYFFHPGDFQKANS
jgi:hypothetical protein